MLPTYDSILGVKVKQNYVENSDRTYYCALSGVFKKQ